MKSIIISTVVGKDAPRVVKAMAETSRSLGGEWQKSKIIHMGQQFAALILVSVDEEVEAELRATLEKTYPDLHFNFEPAVGMESSKAEPVQVELDCKDRPGLTHDITKILSDLTLKAEQMEFHRLPVVPVGSTVYNAKMTVYFDDDSSKDEFVESMKTVCEKVRINFM